MSLIIYGVIAIIVGFIMITAIWLNNKKEMANRSVLHDYYGQMLSRIPCEIQDSLYVVAKDEIYSAHGIWNSLSGACLLSKKEMLRIIEHVLFLLDNDYLKEVFIKKSSLDKYGMYEIVEDLLRRARGGRTRYYYIEK